MNDIFDVLQILLFALVIAGVVVAHRAEIRKQRDEKALLARHREHRNNVERQARKSL